MYWAWGSLVESARLWKWKASTGKENKKYTYSTIPKHATANAGAEFLRKMKAVKARQLSRQKG